MSDSKYYNPPITREEFEGLTRDKMFEELKRFAPEAAKGQSRATKTALVELYKEAVKAWAEAEEQNLAQDLASDEDPKEEKEEEAPTPQAVSSAVQEAIEEALSHNAKPPREDQAALRAYRKMQKKQEKARLAGRLIWDSSSQGTLVK